MIISFSLFTQHIQYTKKILKCTEQMFFISIKILPKKKQPHGLNAAALSEGSTLFLDEDISAY